MLGLDGLLYGTTRYGGVSDGGIVFRMATNGSGFQVLKHFSGANGSNYQFLRSFTWGSGDLQQPGGGLVQAPDGFLYGTATYGGPCSEGGVFRVAPDGGGYAILKSFSGTDGRHPNASMILGPDGALYGTTAFGVGFNAGKWQLIATLSDGSQHSVWVQLK